MLSASPYIAQAKLGRQGCSQAQLGNEPFMFRWNTQNHENPYDGTGLSACAGTAEGGCPTFSEVTENRKLITDYGIT
jgi:hypothetical protein